MVFSDYIGDDDVQEHRQAASSSVRSLIHSLAPGIKADSFNSAGNDWYSHAE